MSSMKLPTLIEAESTAEMFAAVSSVAEHSFFAVAEQQCDAAFERLARPVPQWLVATVRLTNGSIAGSLSCTLGEELARALFDAFTGRDPADPPPTAEEVHDLVGEFSNMVCGAWLSRVATREISALSHPVVAAARAPGAAGNLRLLAAIDDRPLVVDLHLTDRPRRADADRPARRG
jgi:chemotaxis phosphatase CheX-like protein